MQTNIAIIEKRLRVVMLTLPIKVGTEIIDFSKQRFKEQNWLNATYEPWKKRKSSARRNKGRALLIDKGRLRRSIRITLISANSVSVGSDVPYSKVHNDGINTIIRIPAHTRKKIKKGQVETSQLTKKGNKKKRTVYNIIGEVSVKQHTKHMRIPQRRFLGNSQYLNKKIERLISVEIMKVFK